MPNLFFASDHHFHHRKIVEGFTASGKEPTSRPFSSIEEHDEILIQNHNMVVRPEDTVWFGGDVFLSGGDGKEFNYDLLNRMNGNKKLILGNHDTHRKIESYRPYFSQIVGYSEMAGHFGKIILSHIPVHTSQFDTRFKANIHGHTHSFCIDDPRYFNISMEAINYIPISYESIKKILKDRGVI
jgi:calcineurin-like phosphoesterase family protein